MAIQKWSDDIRVAELCDDPQFSEDMTLLMDGLDGSPSDVVLNFAGVGFMNSSNVAKLLRLRKKMMQLGRRLIICDINSHVQGIFSVTGLDKMFDFAGDVSTALATVQLSNGGGDKG